MTTETRNEIESLLTQAGIAPARLQEIKDGCSTDRIKRIISQQLYDCQPGTLVLSDPDAASKALELVCSL